MIPYHNSPSFLFSRSVVRCSYSQQLSHHFIQLKAEVASKMRASREAAISVTCVTIEELAETAREGIAARAHSEEERNTFAAFNASKR